MKITPYQTSDCGEYWDYNFNFMGVNLDISVNKNTGLLYINKVPERVGLDLSFTKRILGVLKA